MGYSPWGHTELDMTEHSHASRAKEECHVASLRNLFYALVI